MQTARRVDPQLRADIERLAERLVPPTTPAAAEALTGAGEMLLDLLWDKPPRTPAQAAASVRVASRIGGPAAMRLISEILSRHAEPSRTRLDDEVIGAWRFFPPDLYVREVLARSWPPGKELHVPDPAFADELYRFPGLRAVRCELGGHGAGISGRGLSSFARIGELRNLAIAGCGEGLDLTPLLQIKKLEHLELAAARRPPALAILSAIPREWVLTIESPDCGDRLSDLPALRTLNWLHLRGCDTLTDLTGLPPRPGSLHGLSLYGCPGLASLNGIGQWDGLTTIELFDCPQITSLTPLASVASVEHISLGLFSEGPRDLSPPAGLPRLKKLSLRGHNTFDVSSLAGIPGVIIAVPPRARVTGAERLGPASRVTEVEFDDHLGGL